MTAKTDREDDCCSSLAAAPDWEAGQVPSPAGTPEFPAHCVSLLLYAQPTPSRIQ